MMDLFREFLRELLGLVRTQDHTLLRLERIMTESVSSLESKLDTLAATESAIATSLTAYGTQILTELNSLQATIAGQAGGGISPDVATALGGRIDTVTALAQSLTAAVAALPTAPTPAAPAPAPAPAPSPAA